ncbi:hypothetical protein Cfor_09178 [Coptotermes formosanus]|uniref:Uncharacterized protein n=1 Tax=Coptotermes formosanus TaxID=36987 RepID=A0A6L2PG43_COPFO|nr:hypothetical protein Cfor_09178 [Coptotermes formosanus]
MNTTACKLPEETGGGYCVLCVEWNPGNFRILLLLNGSAWNGHVRLFTIFSFSLNGHMTARE